MAVVTMKSLLEAGLHFGHKTKSWNPKMKKYIFTERNGIHVINLDITIKCVEDAYAFVREIAKNKDILFVGTKKQSQDTIKKEAERCGMFYMNNRWLGGTLTNFETIKKSIAKLDNIQQMEKDGRFNDLTKKEIAKLKYEEAKLVANLGGIRNMKELPGAMFVVDITKEEIAVKEAKQLGIPVVALVDTNCNPELVDCVIPGNDDAIRSVQLITSIIANAVIEAREGIAFSVDEEEIDENEIQNLENSVEMEEKDAE